MKSKRIPTLAIIAGVLAVVGGWVIAAQDKYTLRVPNGLAFAEFRGYEAWQVVSISQDGDHIAAILANPVMIKAYLAGVPGCRHRRARHEPGVPRHPRRVDDRGRYHCPDRLLKLGPRQFRENARVRRN